MSFKFPVYRPYFTGREAKLVMDCFDSTWISSKGKYINMFESRFASWLGITHALSVSNGTVALHVALEALGVGPDDEVLVPTFTYIACANAVRYTGAKVVFVDSEADYWQIDINDAERKITPKTKAIMPVHIYGHACDMDAVMALARKYSLFVIEDCSEAIGTRYNSQLVGTFGHISTFSFFGNKTITTGEGGMVVTNDDALAQLVLRLKGQGLVQGREYWHDIIGYNYRMTNICAAIGCAQIDVIDEVIAKKQLIASWYQELLYQTPVRMHGVKPNTFHSYWMVSIQTSSAIERDQLRAHLKEEGVETRPTFSPLHLMNMYKEPAGSFPVAEGIGACGINLPSYPDLLKDDVTEICSQIVKFFANSGEMKMSG